MGKKKDLTIKKNSELSVSVNEELVKKFKDAGKRKTEIQDFIRDFLNQFVNESTKKAYIKDLKFFFDFLKTGKVCIGHPKDIQAAHFQFYRDHMIERGLASATINRRLVCIRSFMKWAIAATIIDSNPLDIVKLPKVETQSPTLAFDDDEVVDMINSANTSTKTGLTHRMVMVLLFSLGLRRSELSHIQLKDFNQDRNHSVLSIKGKGGKIRELPLNEYVLKEIDFYLNGLIVYIPELEKEDYLIQSTGKKKNTKPINGSSIFRIIEKYKILLGIDKRLSPHSCRATAISHLLDTQKTPIRDVAIFAGHSKITTTERYDKKRKGLDQSAAYQVDYKKSS
jgi:site-specific recombinase XerD